MNSFRRYPFFAAGLTVCGLIAAGSLGLTYERWSASRDAAQRLRQRRADLEGMGQLNPAPRREIATAIEADLAQARQALEAMRAELTGRPAAREKLRAVKVPAARTDAFFDLATFVERSKEQAAKAGVEVRPEASRFGFSQYANEAPELDRVEAVFRQRQLAEFLLAALFESRPKALVAIKRERPLGKAEQEAAAQALANGQPPPALDAPEGPDYFAVDPRASARVPGFVDTTGFRLTFAGETAALRAFLNRLAAFDLPFLVREVEVELPSADDTAVEGAAEVAPASVVLSTPVAPVREPAVRATRGPVQTPLVPRSLSRFTVTVEHLELRASPPAEGASDSAPPSTGN